MEKKKKIMSSDPKNTFESSWLEYQFLNIFHLIISNVEKPKWQEFVQNQLTEHYVVAIQEEIFNLAMMSIYRKHLEEKLFKFSSLCIRTAWLHLFDWTFLRLDPYWNCDVIGKRAMHLTIDTEPQPPSIDFWTCRKALRIIVEKSSMPKVISPSAILASTKSLNYHDKSKNMQQFQATKSKSIKMKELQETKFLQREMRLKERKQR